MSHQYPHYINICVYNAPNNWRSTCHTIMEGQTKAEYTYFMLKRKRGSDRLRQFEGYRVTIPISDIQKWSSFCERLVFIPETLSWISIYSKVLITSPASGAIKRRVFTCIPIHSTAPGMLHQCIKMNSGQEKPGWTVFEDVNNITDIAPEILMAEINSAISTLEYARASTVLQSPRPLISKPKALIKRWPQSRFPIAHHVPRFVFLWSRIVCCEIIV